MNPIINHISNETFQWFPEKGIGYYPVKDAPYNDAYFDKYIQMSKTDIGILLNKARKDFVETILSDCMYTDIIDIGVGSGSFVLSMQNCKGYDINPKAVEMLLDLNIYKNPYEHTFSNATFWDSLEHIHYPGRLLDNVSEYAFISCPIYRDIEHIFKSKHFRKDEHCWYWTHDGIINFMKIFDFELVDFNFMESLIGREDITTYAFKKVPKSYNKHG